MTLLDGIASGIWHLSMLRASASPPARLRIDRLMVELMRLRACAAAGIQGDLVEVR